TVSFNLAPNTSLGDAVRAIDEARQELGMPASLEAGFQGTAKAFQASLTNQSLLILAALVTVYIILGVLYESYIHPLTILSTLPSAGVGALLALLFSQVLTLYTTPVIYLAFDRLAKRVSTRRGGRPVPHPAPVEAA